jgi:membrane-bound ClpP family serine protease
MRCLIFFVVLLTHISAIALVSVDPVKNTDAFVISITGRIDSRDANDFEELLKQDAFTGRPLHLNVVQLKSEGGSANAAIEIGRLIRLNGLNTYVAPTDYCASACVYAFLGGVQRYGFGVIAVHDTTYIEGSKVVKNDLPSIIAHSDNKIANYLNEMSIGRPLIDAIHSASFWELRTLTENEKLLWRVNGTDRAASEVLVTQIAEKRGMTREDFVRVVSTQYDQCFSQMRLLKQTVWECLAQKDDRFDLWKFVRNFVNFVYQSVMNIWYAF